MNRTFKGFLLIAALLTFAPQVFPQDAEGTPLRIHVRVHNYAQVASEILVPAEVQAAEILGKAGVKITWSNCDPAQANLADGAGCNQLMRPTELGVRILPNFRVGAGITKKTMGLAVGNLASVSVRRVKEDAAEFGVRLCDVLGPAIAHEIGHLLLTQQGHSPTGIMRAHWGKEDYQRAPLGAFKFTAGQAQSIRAEVNRRVEEEGVAPVATTTATNQ